MTEFIFGTGTLIMRRTDTTLAAPALIGTLQDISVDFDRTIESLMGQYNVAAALGGGALKITGKAKFARFQAATLNNLFFGQTVTASSGVQMTTGEAVTVASTPYENTVTNGATFVQDEGVYYAATGVQLTSVASGPTVGQYIAGAVGVGQYTFAAADTGVAMLIYYTYTVATQNKITLANQLMGPMPTFAMSLQNAYNSFGTLKQLFLQLNACSSSKLSLPFSNTKFAIEELDFTAGADAANNWGTLSLTE
jgi:hypothetical protein